MNISSAIAISAILIGVGGCSSEQLYNATKEASRSQCDQLKALPERQRCLNDRGMPYETYKRERDKAASPP